MKLVKQFIEKDKSGYVSLIPEEFEDMWHVYNLIQKHDQLRAVTIRYAMFSSSKKAGRLRLIFLRLLSRLCWTLLITYLPHDTDCRSPCLSCAAYSRIQSESSTGSVESQRIRLTLSISIDNVDFDTQVGMLRISGRVIVENPHVKVRDCRLPHCTISVGNDQLKTDPTSFSFYNLSWEHFTRSIWR